MTKRKSSPYTYTIKKNDKPIPVISEERHKTILTSVEKLVVKKK